MSDKDAHRLLDEIGPKAAATPSKTGGLCSPFFGCVSAEADLSVRYEEIREPDSIGAYGKDD